MYECLSNGLQFGFRELAAVDTSEEDLGDSEVSQLALVWPAHHCSPMTVVLVVGAYRANLCRLHQLWNRLPQESEALSVLPERALLLSQVQSVLNIRSVSGVLGLPGIVPERLPSRLLP